MGSPLAEQTRQPAILEYPLAGLLVGEPMVPPLTPSLSEQAREAAVLEYPAAGLAFRAVVDRVLVEVDARDRCPALRAGLAEPVMHAVGLLVGRAGEAELHALGERLPNRPRQALDLLAGQLGRERVRRKVGAVEDLVRPSAPDPGELALVAEERVEAAALAAEDLSELVRLDL